MKAECPNNKLHSNFLASATVQEDWIVDGNGNVLAKLGQSAVIVEPSQLPDSWKCADCGNAATVTPD
jgi:hypothetical protein